MTSIHDISKYLSQTYCEYSRSHRQTEKLYDAYKQLRDTYSHVTFEERTNLVYKHGFVLIESLIESRERTKYLKDLFDNAHYLTSSKIPSVKLSTTKSRSPHPEMCGVCMEHHSYRNTVTTSCMHHFGKECLSKWIRNCFNTYRDVSCALCRNTDFTIKGYCEDTTRKHTRKRSKKHG